MGGDTLLDSLRLTGAKNKKTNMRMSKADGVIRGGREGGGGMRMSEAGGVIK